MKLVYPIVSHGVLSTITKSKEGKEGERERISCPKRTDDSIDSVSRIRLIQSKISRVQRVTRLKSYL